MTTIYPSAAIGKVTVDGTDVTYVDTRATGSPIVLLHGAGGSIDSHFLHLLPMLAARHRVIALNFATPDGGELSVETLGKQVLAVLDERIPREPVTLVGYSLGAAVAAAVAAEHPARIEHLVLLAGWLSTSRHQKVRNALWREVYSTNLVALEQLMLYSLYSPAYLAARTEAEIRELGRTAATTNELFEQQMRLADDVDISDLAVQVTAHTLVVGCSRDLVAPKDHAEALFGAIVNSRLTYIDSGHAVLTERPAEVFRLVDAFVTERITAPAGAVVPTPAV